MNLKILTERKESFGHNYNLNIKEELKNPLFLIEIEEKFITYITARTQCIVPQLRGSEKLSFRILLGSYPESSYFCYLKIENFLKISNVKTFIKPTTWSYLIR